MEHIRLFKVLVLASTVAYCVWFFLPHFPGYLSTDESRLTEYGGYGAVLPVNHALYSNTWFVLWLGAAVGMFLIRAWARRLYLVLAILSVVAAPLSGFSVQTPLDMMLSSVVLLIDGAILALAYLSPLSLAFTRRRE